MFIVRWIKLFESYFITIRKKIDHEELVTEAGIFALPTVGLEEEKC